jgi:hypothetical protein
MILLNLLYTIACAPVELNTSYEELGCSDWDPNEENQPVLNLEMDGRDLLVYRNYVIQYCDGEFVPAVEMMDSDSFSIREFWNSEDNTCETCFAPTVRIKDYDGQYIEFWWYIGDSAISFNVVDTDVLNAE